MYELSSLERLRWTVTQLPFIVCLQSANFGKGFLGPDVPSEVVNEFVEMCHQLRVLNSVRDEMIGIPITFRQYPEQSYIFP